MGALWVADALFAFANAGATAFHLHWGVGGSPTEDLGSPNTGVQTNFAYNVSDGAAKGLAPVTKLMLQLLLSGSKRILVLYWIATQLACKQARCVAIAHQLGGCAARCSLSE